MAWQCMTHDSAIHRAGLQQDIKDIQTILCLDICHRLVANLLTERWNNAWTSRWDSSKDGADGGPQMPKLLHKFILESMSQFHYGSKCCVCISTYLIMINRCGLHVCIYIYIHNIYICIQRDRAGYEPTNIARRTPSSYIHNNINRKTHPQQECICMIRQTIHS